MKALCILGIFLVFLFAFSSCVGGPNDLEKTPNKKGKIAGFWYNFGFVIGAGLFRFKRKKRRS